MQAPLNAKVTRVVGTTPIRFTNDYGRNFCSFQVRWIDAHNQIRDVFFDQFFVAERPASDILWLMIPALDDQINQSGDINEGDVRRLFRSAVRTVVQYPRLD